MKRIKSIITAMLVALLALPAFARDFEYAGLSFTVLDEEARTCQTKEGSYSFADAKYVPGNDVTGELDIPGTVSDGSTAYSVVKIGAYSFAISGLTSIDVPATVTTIGAGAFLDCFDLEKVRLTESVATLEPYAFGWCTGLNEINLPSTLTSIPTGAFFKSGYRSMKLPESLVSIGAYAFGYSAISIDELPPHLETIGDFAFCSTDGISKMVFPESLVSIGIGAFTDGTEYASYCYLSTAVIPASVQSIGAFAFNNLWNDFDVQYDAVTPISFSESLFNEEVYSRSTLNVPNAALADVLAVAPWNRFARINAKDGSIAPPEVTDRNFEYGGIVYTVLDEEAKTCKIRDQWYAVEEANIPDAMFEGDFVVPSVVSDGTDNYTVVEIGWQSFSSCSKVTSVILPETIKTISRSAFSSSSLTSIKLPESLTWIGRQAFSESDLTSVTIPESITYIGPGVFGNCKKLESVVLPPTLTVIGNDAFNYCESLKTIDLPSSLVALGTGAFSSCWNLEIKEWPESLQSIGTRAMDGKFGDLILPKNLRVINEQAFWQVDMSSLTLPASLEFIGRYAFDRNKLTEITYNASNPITALADIFYVEGLESYQYNAYTDTRLNMPNATLAAAEYARPWGFFDRIYASDGEKDPGMMSGKDFEYEGLVFTIIDNEAKTCRTKAGNFYYGTYTPGNEVTGDVVIPGIAKLGVNDYTVVEVGEYAFVRQPLTSVTIPETVKIIKSFAFEDCKELTSIDIPESVTTMANQVFYGCSGLKSAVLPSSLDSIGSNLFDDCYELTSVTYKAANPLKNDWYMFEPEVYENANLYMPNATLETVQSIEPWMDFKNIKAKDSVIGKTVLWRADSPVGDPIEGWHEFLTLSAEEASILKAGDVITVTVTAKRSDGWPQVGLFEGNVGWPPMTNSGVGDCPCDLTLAITYDIAQKIHENGATIKGESVYVSEISFESSTIDVGPNTVWFGPKQCTWGDAVSVSSNVFSNVKAGDKIVIEYDKSVPEHTLQIIIGGWSGWSLPTYEAWKYDFMTIDEEAGTITIDLIAALADYTVESVDGESTTYNAFTLLKEGGLVIHGPCLVNQVLFIPSAEPELPQVVMSVDPSTDEVETLEDITITFEGADEAKWAADIGTENAPYMVDVVPNIVVARFVKLADEGNVLSLGLYSEFDVKGEYKVIIPAGSYTLNGVSGPEVTLKYKVLGLHVLEAGDDFEYEGLTYTVLDAEARTVETKAGHHSDEAPNQAPSGMKKTGHFGVTGYTIPGNYCEGEIVIPSTVSAGNNEYTVVAIGQDGFHNCENLTSVKFPETLEIIKSTSFEDTGLCSVNFPNSLKEIEGSAFISCDSLKSVIFPESLKKVGELAFYACNKIETVSFPAGIEEIGYAVFDSCYNVKSVTYNAELPIGTDGVFVEEVYESAILEMPNATLADIQVTDGWNLFSHIIAKDGAIGFGASDGEDFEYEGVWYTVISKDSRICKTKEGDWNNGDTYAGNNFTGDLVIPSIVSDGRNDYTVVEIGQRSFWNNTGITSVSIPESVKSCETSCFDDCTSLTRAQFASLEALCGIMFRSTSSNPLYHAHHLYFGEEEVTEIVFPESMTEVRNFTFAGGSSLTSVILHDGITSIGVDAFCGCSGLTSIDFPASLTSMDSSAFRYCTGLTSIELPDGFTELGEYSFRECSGLITVTIPGSVTSIGRNAFYLCNGLTSVNYLATTPITASSNVFDSWNDEVYNETTLNTPNATLADVQATEPWKLFTHIKAKDGSIGFVEAGEIFDYMGGVYQVIDADVNVCRLVDHVTVEGSLSIPDRAVYNSQEFMILEIGSKCFADFSDLTSVSLPSTIDGIDPDAFAGCDRLTSLIWRGDRQMQGTIYDAVGNPNLLVYVDDAKYAPESLDHNVVADGVCESLVLTPGYPFTPATDFTAKSSSMTKEFTQVTGIDGCSGWETIVLPFDVVKVTSPEGHTLLPFGAVTDVNRQRPYWLYEADPAGEWQGASSIMAGIPYIISMPNNPRYNPAYNVSGAVTFSNPTTQVISAANATPYVTTWTSGLEFRSLWLPLSSKEAADAMGLNANISGLRDDNGTLLAPGSAFHAGVVPKPLEGYVARNGDLSSALKIQGLQSAVMTVADEDGLTIAQEGSLLMLRSGADRTVAIYSADGTMLRRVELKAGEAVYVDDLPQGVCLIAGRKVMIL